MTQTPSLANPLVLTTPPGTRSLAPLHGILSDISRYPHMSRFPSKVQSGRNITANIKRSAAASRACPLSLNLSVTTSPVISIINSTQLNGSDLIRIASPWFDSTHWFLTWFDSPVSELIQLTGSWLNLTQHFWLDSDICFLIDLTLCLRLDLNHLFPTWFISRFLIGFDSVFLFSLTHV